MFLPKRNESVNAVRQIGYHQLRATDVALLAYLYVVHLDVTVGVFPQPGKVVAPSQLPDQRPVLVLTGVAVVAAAGGVPNWQKPLQRAVTHDGSKIPPEA